MKTKLLSLMLLVGCFIATISAQTSEFNLSDYKLPDFKRQTLDLTFNLSGNKYTSSLANSQKNGSLASDLGLTYTKTQNSRTVQREIYDYLNFAGKSYSAPSSNPSESDMYAFNIQSQINNRYYFQPRTFLETDFNFVLYSKNSYEETLSGTESGNSKNWIVSLPIKVGFGRIERVEDARQAVYILDALAKENRAKNNFDKSTILAFAKRISELKNKRYFDSRIKKIEQIEAVDSFLSANGISLKTDARFYTTLNDMWDFGDRQIRQSGSRMSLGLFPGYIKNSYDTDLTYEYKSLHTGIEWTLEKPSKLSIQKSYNAYLFVGATKSTEKFNTTTESATIPSLKIGISNSIGYFPNTRTDITFNYGIFYGQLFGKNDASSEPSNYDNKLFQGNLNLNANYYFSPKLRLSANAYSSLYLIKAKDNQDITYDIITRANFFNSGGITRDYNNQAYGFELKLTYAFF